MSAVSEFLEAFVFGLGLFSLVRVENLDSDFFAVDGALVDVCLGPLTDFGVQRQ